MTNQPSGGSEELNVNKLEEIIADHNKNIRIDVASEISGGNRTQAIADVITVKAILKWHEAEKSSAIQQFADGLVEQKQECEIFNTNPKTKIMRWYSRRGEAVPLEIIHEAAKAVQEGE